MLEIRHALPGEFIETAAFFEVQEGRTPPQSSAKIMLAKQDGEILAALFYHEETASTGERRLVIDWLSFCGDLSGELERCMTALLVQKALREGIPFITSPLRENGFIMECFERQEETLLLDVARSGWTVLQKADRCRGCHGGHS